MEEEDEQGLSLHAASTLDDFHCRELISSFVCLSTKLFVCLSRPAVKVFSLKRPPKDTPWV